MTLVSKTKQLESKDINVRANGRVALLHVVPTEAEEA